MSTIIFKNIKILLCKIGTYIKFKFVYNITIIVLDFYLVFLM